MVGLGIVGGAESSETFIAKVGLKRINSLDNNIKSEVKLFLIN
jgi:hypothetical protein